MINPYVIYGSISFDLLKSTLHYNINGNPEHFNLDEIVIARNVSLQNLTDFINYISEKDIDITDFYISQIKELFSEFLVSA